MPYVCRRKCGARKGMLAMQHKQEEMGRWHWMDLTGAYRVNWQSNISPVLD